MTAETAWSVAMRFWGYCSARGEVGPGSQAGDRAIFRIAGWAIPARAIAAIPTGPAMNLVRRHASRGCFVELKMAYPEPPVVMWRTFPAYDGKRVTSQSKKPLSVGFMFFRI